MSHTDNFNLFDRRLSEAKRFEAYCRSLLNITNHFSGYTLETARANDRRGDIILSPSKCLRSPHKSRNAPSGVEVKWQQSYCHRCHDASLTGGKRCRAHKRSADMYPNLFIETADRHYEKRPSGIYAVDADTAFMAGNAHRIYLFDTEDIRQIDPGYRIQNRNGSTEGFLLTPTLIEDMFKTRFTVTLKHLKRTIRGGTTDTFQLPTGDYLPLLKDLYHQITS